MDVSSRRSLRGSVHKYRKRRSDANWSQRGLFWHQRQSWTLLLILKSIDHSVARKLTPMFVFVRLPMAQVFPRSDAIILSVCSHFAKTPSETMKSIHAPYFSRTIDTLTHNGQRPGSTLKWDWLHGSVTDIFKAKLSILPAVLEDIDWPFKDPQNIVFCDNIAKHQTSKKERGRRK